MKINRVIYLVVLTGLLLPLLFCCKKESVKDVTPVTPWVSNKNIIFNPNLTFGTISDIDGNIYKTIQIGTQTWFAENLKTTKYNNGISIPNVTGQTDWNNLITPAYCWYRNDSATYKANYGALYNWYTVNTGKICPVGWHVASSNEWDILAVYLGGVIKGTDWSSLVGGKLKETGTIHWISPNGGATNETGFTALPGGGHFNNDLGYDIGKIGYWWTSTESTSSNKGAASRTMFNGDITLGRYGSDYEYYGMSVRCIKD